MQAKRLTAIAIFFLTLITLLLLAEPAKTIAIVEAKFPESRLKDTQPKSQKISQSSIQQGTQPKAKQSPQNIYISPEINQFAPVFGCEVQPPDYPPNPSLPVALTSIPITLDRFRKTSTTPSQKSIIYKPVEIIALANASNYGDRYLKDLLGNPANRSPIIVLHETVGSANSVINFFQEFHTEEEDQASYHTLVALDGTIIYFVPPDKRAFGAGNSVFISRLGRETVQTNPRYPSSVNNFAYHISLETPADGLNDATTHSGYTEAQYQSLAWLVAKTDVPLERITTHQIIDLSGSRIDPRSFDFNLFQRRLSEYPRTNEVVIGCTQNLTLGDR